jgi:hypothetical protein
MSEMHLGATGTPHLGPHAPRRGRAVFGLVFAMALSLSVGPLLAQESGAAPIGTSVLPSACADGHHERHQVPASG